MQTDETGQPQQFSRLATIAMLTMVLLLALGVRLYRLDYNSPFYDEALYVRLGQSLWEGSGWEENPWGWVGGLPAFYPVLSALFYGLGGLAGARLFNVALGVAAVYFMFELTRWLNLSGSKERAKMEGVLVALMLAVSAIPVHLSRLAIYDMLSFALFTAGLAVLARGVLGFDSEERTMKRRLVGSALLLGLSFLAKYVTLGVLPLVAVWAMAEARMQDKRKFMDVAAWFIVPLAVFVGGYGMWMWEALLEFGQNQIPDAGVSTWDILRRYLQYTALPLALALMASATVKLKRRRWMPLVLTGAGVWMAVVHVMGNNSASVHQHSFLGLVFLMPAAALVMYEMLARLRFMGAVLVLLIMIALTAQSIGQVRSLDASWPNSSAVSNYLKEKVRPSDKVLSIEDDVTALAVNDVSVDVTGPYYFEYGELEGDEAYQAAVRDGYFDWALLADFSEETAAEAVRSMVGVEYEIVYEDYPYVVYQRKP